MGAFTITICFVAWIFLLVGVLHILCEFWTYGDYFYPLRRRVLFAFVGFCILMYPIIKIIQDGLIKNPGGNL